MKKFIVRAGVSWLFIALLVEQYKQQQRIEKLVEVNQTHHEMLKVLVATNTDPVTVQALNALGNKMEFERITKDM